MSNMKKVCIIYSNCQNRLLAKYLHKSKEFNQKYTIKRYRAHLLMRKGATIPDKVLKQAELFIYQPVKNIHGISSSEYLLSRLSRNCQCISFPSIYFTGYFPQYCRNPVPQTSNINYPGGIIPHGDANIITMLKQGFKEKEIITKLCDPNFYSQKFLLLNLQQTLEELARRESELTIKISNFIRVNYRDYYLFHTQNHPSDILGVYVANQILKQIHLPTLGNELSFNNPSVDVLNHIQLPIYPSVIKNLELTFAKDILSYRHGSFYTDKMTLEKYVSEYINFNNLTSGTAEYHFINGIKLANKSDFNSAKVAFDRAIAIQPDRGAYHRELGDLLYNQNKLAEAESAYRKAILLSPDWGELYRPLAEVLIKQKKFDSAIQVYQRIITLIPNDADLKNSLGNVLAKQYDYELAELYYKEAIALDPHKAYFYRCLGDCLLRKNTLEQAIFNYRRAIELAPTAAYLYIRLGNTLAKQNNLSEAIAACQKAISLNQKNPNFYRILGNIQLQQGNVNASFGSYQQAIKLNSNQIEQIFFQLSHFLQEKTNKTTFIAQHVLVS